MTSVILLALSPFAVVVYLLLSDFVIWIRNRWRKP